MFLKRKIKAYIALIFILGLTIQNLKAQSIPGYFGHRWLVKYDAHLFPSFANPNTADIEVRQEESRYGAYEKGEPNVKTSLNYSHNFVVDYVTGKQWALGLDFGVLNTYTNMYSGHYGSLYNFDSLVITNNHKFPKTKAIIFGAHATWFSKHIAPVGIYSSFKLGLSSISIEDFSYDVYSFDTNTITKKAITGSSDLNTYLGFEMGVNRIIKDRFIVSFGFDTKLLFSLSEPYLIDASYRSSIISSTSDFFEYITIEDNSKRAQDELLNYAKGRVFMNYLFNFKIGIGVLL